jgi:hypothetical protein
MSYLTSTTAKLLGASILTLLLAATGCAGRGTYRASYVATYSEPPPPRVVVVDDRPGYIWVDGRWVWGGSSWVWYDGYYVAERPGYVWVQGTWRHDGGRWHWHEGRWHTPERARVIVRDHQPVVRDRRGATVRVQQPAVRVKVKGKARVRVND